MLDEVSFRLSLGSIRVTPVRPSDSQGLAEFTDRGGETMIGAIYNKFHGPCLEGFPADEALGLTPFPSFLPGDVDRVLH